VRLGRRSRAEIDGNSYRMQYGSRIRSTRASSFAKPVKSLAASVDGAGMRARHSAVASARPSRSAFIDTTPAYATEQPATTSSDSGIPMITPGEFGDRHRNSCLTFEPSAS
jgi:hypothetical protein